MSIPEKLTVIAENIPEVYEAGKKAEYDRFWNSYQSNGNRTAYSYAFSYGGWNDETYNPKYQPKPKDASYMFSNTRITEKKIDVDFSEATSLNYAFVGAYYVKYIGVIDTRKAKSNLTHMLSYSRALRTIDKIILCDDGSQTFSNTFLECNALKNIVIEGTIGKSVNFQWSPLSKESIENIFEHLSDTASAQTLTLKKSAKEEAFTDEEWDVLTSTKPNWTISLI